MEEAEVSLSTYTGGLGTIISTGDQQENYLTVIKLDENGSQGFVQRGMILKYRTDSFTPQRGGVYEITYSNSGSDCTVLRHSHDNDHPFGDVTLEFSNHWSCYYVKSISLGKYAPMGDEINNIVLWLDRFVVNGGHLKSGMFLDFPESHNPADVNGVGFCWDYRNYSNIATASSRVFLVYDQKKGTLRASIDFGALNT